MKVKVVIFDYTGTLFNPFSGTIYPEVPKVLKSLKEKGLKLALVTKAGNILQKDNEFKKLNLDKYFDVLDVIPVEAKKEFSHILGKLKIKGTECAVVGDRVKGEILEGNRIGAKTVWILQGEFLDEIPENELEQPDYKIKSISEITNLLLEINSQK